MKKFQNRQEVLDFLGTLPLNSLITVAADAILELQKKSTDKIIISEEQFNAFFRIRGYRENGEKENRGRLKGQAWKNTPKLFEESEP